MSDWGKNININELLADMETVNTDFDEIQTGKYEVKLISITPMTSKNNHPMLEFKFKIIVGDFKNRYFWQYKTLHKGVCIHFANEFLKELFPYDEIKFEDFDQYERLVEKLNNKINKYEYVVSYENNGKDFANVIIEEVFEV